MRLCPVYTYSANLLVVLQFTQMYHGQANNSSMENGTISFKKLFQISNVQKQTESTLAHINWTETAGITSIPLCLLPVSVLPARRAKLHRGWFWNHYSIFVSIPKPIQASFRGTFICQAADNNGIQHVSCMVQLPGDQVGQLWNHHIFRCSGSTQLCPGDDNCAQAKFKKVFSPLN